MARSQGQSQVWRVLLGEEEGEGREESLPTPPSDGGASSGPEGIS